MKCDRTEKVKGNKINTLKTNILYLIQTFPVFYHLKHE